MGSILIIKKSVKTVNLWTLTKKKEKINVCSWKPIFSREKRSYAYSEHNVCLGTHIVTYERRPKLGSENVRVDDFLHFVWPSKACMKFRWPIEKHRIHQVVIISLLIIISMKCGEDNDICWVLDGLVWAMDGWWCKSKCYTWTLRPDHFAWFYLEIQTITKQHYDISVVKVVYIIV